MKLREEGGVEICFVHKRKKNRLRGNHEKIISVFEDLVMFDFTEHGRSYLATYIV